MDGCENLHQLIDGLSWFIHVYPMIFLDFNHPLPVVVQDFAGPSIHSMLKSPQNTSRRGAFVSAHDLCQRLFLPVQVTLKKTLPDSEKMWDGDVMING